MDVSPVQTSSTETTPLQANTDEASKIEANFDTFLALLTAQLRNQDPLEPVDSTDFVAQLAQFSAVEQQVQTNNALNSILGQLGGGDVGSLASWLGAEVQSSGPVFFDGSPLTLTTTPSPDATQSNLVVRNAAGEVIARQPVNGIDSKVSWNGLDLNGVAAPEGLYSFTVESANGTTILPTQQAAGFTKVEEVRVDGDEPILVLQGGDAVALDDVLAVR